MDTDQLLIAAAMVAAATGDASPAGIKTAGLQLSLMREDFAKVVNADRFPATIVEVDFDSPKVKSSTRPQVAFKADHGGQFADSDGIERKYALRMDTPEGAALADQLRDAIGRRVMLVKQDDGMRDGKKHTSIAAIMPLDAAAAPAEQTAPAPAAQQQPPAPTPVEDAPAAPPAAEQPAPAQQPAATTDEYPTGDPKVFAEWATSHFGITKDELTTLWREHQMGSTPVASQYADLVALLEQGASQPAA